MPSVTLDTNVLPAGELRSLEAKGFTFAFVSVTERELGNTALRAELSGLDALPETAVWDEGAFGVGTYGAPEDDRRLDRILQVITNGSFPRNRSELTASERRQLRDAIIFHAHVREGREIFVTNDARAFIDHGRRGLLESEFATRVMTKDEFLASCSAIA